jgi:hypothetical protein
VSGWQWQRGAPGSNLEMPKDTAADNVT